MSPKDLLIEAKNLINVSGWTQGIMWNEKHEYCAIGALIEVAKVATDSNYMAASGEEEEKVEGYHEAIWTLAKAVPDLDDDDDEKGALTVNGNQLDPMIERIVIFNDDGETSKQDVLDMFDKAIVSLDDTSAGS